MIHTHRWSSGAGPICLECGLDYDEYVAALERENAELREIAVLVAKCRIDTDHWSGPMLAPDDVSTWDMIIRARRATGITPNETDRDAEEPADGVLRSRTY